MTDQPQRGRPGRPKDANSAETRRRILDAGRRLFSDLGYGGTSNRMLAEAAGLTTGAIYHYFDSKLEVYKAVREDASDLVGRRLGGAVEGQPTFIAALEAVLEEAHELNIADPSLARFVASFRLDLAREPELANSFDDINVEREIWRQLVDVGLKSGEIDPANEWAVRSLLQTVALGLTVIYSHDIARHRAVIQAILGLFEGKLIKPAVALTPPTD
ncbi:MAG: TetR/AcrR family transcriptional regulator [Actinomycetota bacterium]